MDRHLYCLGRTTLMPSATTDSTSVWDSTAVSAFAKGNDDVLIVERRPLAGLEAAVQSARVHECYVAIKRENAASEVRAALREIRIKSSELEEDMIKVVNSFFDQFHVAKANLRVEILLTQPCPNFHCDNVHVRLVTTYFGPTTEYQYAGEGTTRSAPLCGFVFLKGHRHPTHRDTVHHRSPEICDGDKRLCMAIDY